MRGVDGQPPHGVVKPIHGFVPGADRNTAPAATGPLFLVHTPEDNALFSIDPPFAKSRIVVHGIGNFLTGFAFGYGPGRAKFGTTFTGHAKIMRAKGNGLVRKQGQICGDGFEAHIVAVFRG